MLDIDKEIENLTKEIDRAKKYDKPFFIIISGYPGSGKTFLAWNLSKYLKIVISYKNLIMIVFEFFQERVIGFL